MKKLINVITILLALSVTSLYAENKDGHKHRKASNYNMGVSSIAIQETAKREVARLVREKKVHNSWESVEVFKIGRNPEAYIDDWIVVFKNPKIKKKSRQSLYIFVSRAGNVMGANYSGK